MAERRVASQFNFGNAVSHLRLTPQEQYLYMTHLNNLLTDGKVVHDNGDISTLYQAVVPGPDGKYYNIPTVWGGKILPVPEAFKNASAAGMKNWPSYDTPEQADERYNMMHDYMDKDVGAFLGLR